MPAACWCWTTCFWGEHVAGSGKLTLYKPASGSGKLVLGDAPAEAPAPPVAGLVFRKLASGSGKLVFGDTGEPGTTPDAHLGADAGFAGDAAASATLRLGRRVTVDAGFAGEGAASATLVWDSNTSRPLLARRQPIWQQGMPTAGSARSHWQNSRVLHAAQRQHWQQGAPIAAAARPRWQNTQPLRAGQRVGWQLGQPVTIDVRAAFEQAIALRAGARVGWQWAVPLATAAQRQRFQEMLRLRPATRGHFQPALPIASRHRDVLRTGLPMGKMWRELWQLAMPPLPGRTPPAPPVEPPHHLCYDPARLGLLVFERPYSGTGKLVFVCVGHDEPEPPGEPIIVAPRRTWIVINSIELRRADDGTLLPCEAFAMQLDADSWTWSFSATIAWAQRAAVEPGIGGMPVELEAKVNGVPYRLQAERVGRSVRFPEKLAKVSGRGKAAILDAPYAAVQSFTNASGMTAQQIMEGVLTVGGVGIGWGLDFGLTDWVVPAGAWSHQGTYISALADIAGAVGGYLQPHATAATLRVLPRWPAPWWDWASATPDIILPAGVAEVEETEWIDHPAYNRIYVHGQAGGIAARITRTGTAGDVLKPTAVHPLITAELAARQRGVAELAASGRAIKQTITTMVLPATGLITPGKLVQYTDADATRLGLVRGTSVAWQFPALTQTLEIESHV